MLFAYVIKTHLYEKTVVLIKNISFAIFSAGSAPPRDASVQGHAPAYSCCILIDC